MVAGWQDPRRGGRPRPPGGAKLRNDFRRAALTRPDEGVRAYAILCVCKTKSRSSPEALRASAKLPLCLFAKEGAKIAITGRNEKRGHAVIERILNDGGQAIFLRTDVRKVHECRRAVDETVSAFGRVDILFNNAGVFLSPHDARLQRGRMGPAN